MILIKGGTLLTLTERGVIDAGDVEIDGSRISYVGKTKKQDSEFEKVINASGFFVMPGLVNTHTHLAMVLMRGIADDVPLQKWLNNAIFPIESKLGKDDIYFGSLLALIESIKSGVTTVADFYFHMDAVAKSVKETGARANLGFGLASKFDMDTVKLKIAEKFVNQYNNTENGRILASFAPHAPYTCTIKFLKAISKRAKEMGVLVHTHLHETEKEIVDFKKLHGKTPIQKLYEEGFFNAKVNAAHCVYMEEDDYKILKENNAGVALNPQSNLKLGSGIPDIPAMLKYNLSMGIGTDGASSNNNLALIEDMRLVSFLAKGSSRNPELLNAEKVLKMATVNGARNIGFKKLGLIKEGFLADIILIDKNSANLLPNTNPYSLVAYSMYPGDVDTVIINGKIVMQNKKLLTIDEGAVKKEIVKFSKKITL
jgi:5-methylthioadenosine/S-adenosylhomocysteine deaminase